MFGLFMAIVMIFVGALSIDIACDFYQEHKYYRFGLWIMLAIADIAQMLKFLDLI